MVNLHLQHVCKLVSRLIHRENSSFQQKTQLEKQSEGPLDLEL